MRKYSHTNKYILTSGLSLFFALACAVAAVCLWRYIPSEHLFYYVASACALVLFLVYVIVCAVASKKREDGKSYFLLAWAIVGVSVILIALSPLAAIMWVIETIVESAQKQK